MISIRLNAREIQKELNNIRKQARFATAVALTNTAKKIKDREQKEIRQVFDRPKPFTINSLFIKPANKRQQDPFAIVGLKNKITSGTPSASYLYQQIHGGSRRYKKAEGKLRGGGILPPGYKISPGRETKLNKFGNLTKTHIKNALTANNHGSKYFVSTKSGRTKHLAKGVWRRKGRGGRKIVPFIIFITQAQYKKKFKFYEVGTKEFAMVFDGIFSKAFDRAMRSAK